MPPLLEVRHLALVDAIAQAGSVTRAAERLHLTQSALSHQLLDIEARAGLPFFARLGRRMLLTPAGERVLASARRVLDDLGRAEDDLRAMAAGGKGVLRLCTECNTGYHWLPPLLHDFHARFPLVDINIKVDATNRPLDALLEGEIDLAVMTSSVADARVTATAVFEDEMMAVVAPSHPFAARPFVEIADFASEHLLLHRVDRRASFTFARILMPAGVEPARVSEVPLTEAILELIKAGLGIGVLAGWAIEPARRNGSVAALRIGRDGVRRTWTAVTLKDRPRAIYLAEFVKLLAARGPSAAFAPATSLLAKRDERIHERGAARGHHRRRNPGGRQQRQRGHRGRR
jgi:LysR family transcriptional regulator for metE and metH